jgi:hypothetical protein
VAYRFEQLLGVGHHRQLGVEIGCARQLLPEFAGPVPRLIGLGRQAEDRRRSALEVREHAVAIEIELAFGHGEVPALMGTTRARA